MNRRNFARGLGLGTSAILASRSVDLASSLATAPATPRSNVAREMKADVVIIGGSTGGCAAALAAARNRCRVIMT